MNACTAVAAEIDDVALEARTNDVLAAHLTSCADCTALLERKRAIAMRIERTVEHFVRAEPSPALAERIHAGAAARRSRRRVVAWWGAPVGVAFATALLIIVSVLAVPRGEIQPTNVSTLAAWRSPTRSLLISHSNVLGAPFTLRGLRGDSRPVRS